MKTIARLLALIACLLVTGAIAAPCMPSKPSDVRVGVVYKEDGSPVGAWAYWWCVSGTTVTYEWRAAPITSFSRAVMDNLRAYAAGTNPGFPATATTLAANDPVLVPMRAAVIAAVVADAGKPKP